MGFFSKITGGSDIGGLPGAGSIVGGFTGATGAAASLEGAQLQFDATKLGIEEQREARLSAEARLQPFAEFGLETLGDLRGSVSEGVGVAPASQILSDPFFQAIGADQDRRLIAQQAALGKAGAGGTKDALARQQLLLGNQFRQQDFGNRLQANQQRFGQLFNITNLGQSSAAGQANAGLRTAGAISDPTTQGGNALAAGGIGAANAQAQGSQNLAAGAMGLLAAFSDERLKTDVKFKSQKTIGDQIYNWYTWTWNELAESLNLTGVSEGVIAQQVQKIKPGAVFTDSGFLKVNYGAL